MSDYGTSSINDYINGIFFLFLGDEAKSQIQLFVQICCEEHVDSDLLWWNVGVHINNRAGNTS